jgi:hypothetical protein
MVMAVFAVLMLIKELNPVMSKVVESVSVATFPAAAVMDELSEVQLAMVLAISVLTVLVLLLVALALVSIAAANKERWSLAVAIGASMISMKIMRHEMRSMSFVPTGVRRWLGVDGERYSNVIFFFFSTPGLGLAHLVFKWT